jgi:hypothetical protein
MGAPAWPEWVVEGSQGLVLQIDEAEIANLRRAPDEGRNEFSASYPTSRRTVILTSSAGPA